MRRSPRRSAVLVLMLLAGCSYSAAALDLGAEGWAGNLGFATDRVATDTTFPGANYFWGVSLFASQQINDSISFDAGFAADPVLRNLVYTMFSYSQSILTVGVGPFFGFFNDFGTLLKPGISTSVKLELPGIIYLSFRADSSIGGELAQVGDYLQEKSSISLGLYVPHAILSANIDTRKFTQRQAASNVVDAETAYSLCTDIFQKNVPYRVLVTFAYQTNSKSFVTTTPVTDTLNSIVIGTDLYFNITEALALHGAFKGSVYTFGQGSLVGSATSFLFQASAGVRINLDKIGSPVKKI